MATLWRQVLAAVNNPTIDNAGRTAAVARGIARTAKSMPTAERVRVVKDLTRDDEVATSVTSKLLQRPRIAQKAMRNDVVRFTVNPARFDNTEQVCEQIRESISARRTPRGPLACENVALSHTGLRSRRVRMHGNSNR